VKALLEEANKELQVLKVCFVVFVGDGMGVVRADGYLGPHWKIEGKGCLQG